MSGKSSQAKGRRGELELARVLQDYGLPVKAGDPANRGRTPDLVGLPFIHTEVKRVERLNVSEAMAQARRDSLKFKDGMPAVFHRRSREGWLVTMDLADWIVLYMAHDRQKPPRNANRGEDDTDDTTPAKGP